MKKLLLLVATVTLSMLSSVTVYALPADFTKLNALGHEFESIALEVSDSSQQQSYFHYLQEIKFDSENGYLGPKQNPFLSYNEAINQVSNFIAYLDSNYQEIRKSDEERSNDLYALLGAAYALKTASLNLVETKEVSFLQRKLYEKNCFRFGTPEGRIENLSRFLWMATCYEDNGGGYDEANTTINELYLATMTSPSFKAKAFSIGTDFSWRAARRNLNDVNYFSFTPNSYIENKISLLNRVVFLASETKNPITQYEALKTLHELYQKTQNKKELNNTEQEMVKLLRKEKKISWIQEVVFFFRRFYLPGSLVILFVFPLATFLKLFMKQSQEDSRRFRDFGKFMLGVEVEMYDWYWKILRTLWVLLLGLVLSALITEISLNLTDFTLLN